MYLQNIPWEPVCDGVGFVQCGGLSKGSHSHFLRGPFPMAGKRTPLKSGEKEFPHTLETSREASTPLLLVTTDCPGPGSQALLLTPSGS